MIRTYSTMCAFLILIESPHTQSTDVTCSVITRRNRVVDNRARTDEANLCLWILFLVVIASIFRRLRLRS